MVISVVNRIIGWMLFKLIININLINQLMIININIFLYYIKKVINVIKVYLNYIHHHLMMYGKFSLFYHLLKYLLITYQILKILIQKKTLIIKKY